jgi:hypothetical protein
MGKLTVKFHMKFLLIISTTMLLASATLCKGFSGGLYSVFEMDRCVGDAKLIARGFLDEKGNLDTKEVFKGEQPTNSIVVADGAKAHQRFLASINAVSEQPTNTIEVVAFLGSQTASGEWQPVSGYAGLTALKNTNVYLFGFSDAFDQPPVARRDKHFNRESFLFAVKDSVRLSDQRDALAAMPRVSERAQKLISFLLDHGGSYHRLRIVASFRPINPDEKKEILKEIETTHDIAAKSLLIDLAGDIPLSPDAFDSVVPLIDAQNPRQLRRSAMWAISRINPPEATKRILPFINIAEPELDEALTALGTPPTGVSPDLKVVDALLSLSTEMRKQDEKGIQPVSDSTRQALLQQLPRYVHSKLLTFYFDWLISRTPSDSDYVTSDLQAMLGVRWPSDQLKTWWKQQQTIIASDYDPESETDQSRWLDAYKSADDVSKRFLVRTWIFTSATNQLALVKAATKETTADAAKAAITELWSNNNLGNEGKQSMFENFLKVDLVDQAKSNPSRFKDQHELSIVLTFNYPFNTCISYLSPIAIDGKVVKGTTYGGSVCPDLKLKEYRLGAVGGYVPGEVATGTFEIYQLDHYPDGKKLWNVQWPLGPIKLKE